MAKIPNLIIINIKNYLKLLEENGFPIQKAIIFGSYTSGTQNEWSNIDLAIVSEGFEGIRILDKQKIRGLNRRIDSRILPLPYKPSDFNESFFVEDEIIKKGIPNEM